MLIVLQVYFVLLVIILNDNVAVHMETVFAYYHTSMHVE